MTVLFGTRLRELGRRDLLFSLVEFKSVLFQSSVIMNEIICYALEPHLREILRVLNFYFSEINIDITPLAKLREEMEQQQKQQRERESVCVYVCYRGRGNGFSFIAFSFQPCAFYSALPGLEIFLFFLSFFFFFFFWWSGNRKSHFLLVWL